MFEACNTHSSEFTWASGEWEECSATCGDDGVQERQLFCVPLNVRSPKPEIRQPCNRLPCPVYWREMPWTQCSTTCGRGISRQPLVFSASDLLLCGPRPRKRHRRCCVRHCGSLSRPACPPADTTQYCELFDSDQLARHCLVPPFRKYCCKACRLLERNHFRGYGLEI